MHGDMNGQKEIAVPMSAGGEYQGRGTAGTNVLMLGRGGGKASVAEAQ